jgi:hypothetical protein
MRLLQRCVIRPCLGQRKYPPLCSLCCWPSWPSTAHANEHYVVLQRLHALGSGTVDLPVGQRLAALTRAGVGRVIRPGRVYKDRWAR